MNADIGVAPTPSNATEQCLLAGGRCDDGRLVPCAAHYPRACLSTPIPAWRHPFIQIRCCLSCCTRHWMARNMLSSNEQHWTSLTGHVGWSGGRVDDTDDWSGPSLLPHASGEVLLGHMSFALLAEGNIFSFRRVDRLKFVPHALSRRLLVLHSNSVAAAEVLLAWLNSSAGEARLARAASVSMISRDDAAMPSARMAAAWQALRQRWQAGPRLRWFVQNALGHQDGLASLPIGARGPSTLSSFLQQGHGIEARVRHRRTLLMCCCMQNQTSPRQLALSALRRNGFACDDSDLPPNERVRPGAPASWPYYAGLAHAKFVASPMGYGRDCYRTWEAIVLGAVPVLLLSNSSQLDRAKFEGLPVLWVHSWEQVTRPYLESAWAEIRGSARVTAGGDKPAYDLRRAFFPFWLGAIRQTS
jgi:hypothetical protein